MSFLYTIVNNKFICNFSFFIIILCGIDTIILVYYMIARRALGWTEGI